MPIGNSYSRSRFARLTVISAKCWSRGEPSVIVSGDVFVPKYFDVHASLQDVEEDEPREVGLWVELGCQTFNGRDVYANEVKVVDPVQVLPGDPLGRGVTGDLLRDIPVKRLAKWGLRLIAMERSAEGEWHRVMPETERGRFTWRSHTAAGVTERPGLNLWAIDADIAATLEKTFGAAKTQKVGRRPTRDEKFWEEIAAAYCGAVENHEPTIDAVQKSSVALLLKGLCQEPHHPSAQAESPPAEARPREVAVGPLTADDPGSTAPPNLYETYMTLPERLPAAVTSNKKNPRLAGVSLKRMKGLEPSTFCMARRRREWTGVDWTHGNALLCPFRQARVDRS